MLLKEKIRIGGVEIGNRLVMPPMLIGKAEEGRISDEMIEYYRVRSGKGAVGLIITECSAITRGGRLSPTEITIADREDLPGHRKLTEAVHREGSRIFIQLHHAGAYVSPDIPDPECVGPSAVKHVYSRPNTGTPRELSIPEIKKIEEAFAASALLAREAGYDGVELHAAHGYLLNQFYSTLSNKRTDEYGAGSVENRIRMTMETLKKVREAVGTDYPVAVRLGGCDYTEGGSRIEDAVEAAKLLEKAGCDLLDLTGGLCGFNRKDDQTPGWFRDLTGSVKKAVGIPVVLTGGITEAGQAEALLSDGFADMIGVGRAILKDGDWALREMNR